MKIVIITAAPTPFRDPVHAKLSQFEGDEVTLIYCSYREPIRKWNVDSPIQNAIFLKENFTKKKDGFNFVHNNPDVWKNLSQIDPDVIITTGFSPTYLYAWLYATTHGKKHIMFMDGWKYSESFLSKKHRIIRKMVYAKTHAFVGPGINTAELYKSYGAKDEQIFISHLCADNENFDIDKSFEDREYDLMFAGRFHELKCPFFFVDVITEVKKVRPQTRALLIGSGPLEEELMNMLNERGIDYHYPGFIQPDELPTYYSNARLLLFPTKNDCWGLVANEAMASGTPVIVTPFAGLINDLVLHEHNGYVLELEKTLWAEKALHLLENPEIWQTFSDNSRNKVQEYNFDNAAHGLFQACKYAYNL